ncbi:thioesterase family protein [Patulibacter sp.]|uniref:thioesterase family protein n=1 Tax=Patulibacter sp. TaxID=1912859 RepID=UPI00271592AA|nr:thioesterase family protein [Patulibacter sp.]MDO9410501.1 thioesterase family protein [Patulibacter sp.]
MSAPDVIATPGPVAAGGEGTSTWTLHPVARGPWDAASAHGGAPAALLARAVEALAVDGQRISSLSYTFLGPVPIGEVEIETRVTKGGRRFQVVEASLRAGGRTAMELRAVLLRRGRVALPAGIGAPWPELPPPEGLEPTPSWFLPEGEVAFHPTAMEIRVFGGSLDEPAPDGRSAWLRLRLPVVEGEAPSGAQRAAAAADFGNGLSTPVGFDGYLFVNCDLHVAVHRDPAGEWIGVRSRTELDRAGTGLTTTELHDAAGRFGTATQTLFVDTR